jgi:hypothetical protein
MGELPEGQALAYAHIYLGLSTFIALLEECIVNPQTSKGSIGVSALAFRGRLKL